MSLAAIFGLVLWTLLFGIVLVVGGLRTSVPAQARCARASSDCRRYSGAMLKVGSIVLRVEDLSRQTVFWSAALDYETRIDRHDFVLLAPRDGTGPNMSLDIAPSEVHVPPRISLDLIPRTRRPRSSGSSGWARARSIGTNAPPTRTT